MKEKTKYSILLFALIFWLGACQQSIKTVEEANGLTGALLYMPERDDYRFVYYSDWVRLKETNSTSNFGWNGLGNQWMWTEADLDWAAEIALDGGVAPIRILNFQDDFDLGPIVDTFIERGFTRVDTEKATTLTHAPDLSSYPPILSYTNTIIIPDALVMVFTSGGAIENFDAIIEFYTNPGAGASISGSPTGDCLVDGLGDAADGMVDMKNCSLLNI